MHAPNRLVVLSYIHIIFCSLSFSSLNIMSTFQSSDLRFRIPDSQFTVLDFQKWYSENTDSNISYQKTRYLFTKQKVPKLKNITTLFRKVHPNCQKCSSNFKLLACQPSGKKSVRINRHTRMLCYGCRLKTPIGKNLILPLQNRSFCLKIANKKIPIFDQNANF